MRVLIMNKAHYVTDVLLMFETSYNLPVREGAECGGSPWLRMEGGGGEEGVIYNLSGTGDKFY